MLILLIVVVYLDICIWNGDEFIRVMVANSISGQATRFVLCMLVAFLVAADRLYG